MLPPTAVPLRTLFALGFALAFGAGSWLVVLHDAEGGHERGEPSLLLHALRDGSLALPGVLAAVWLGATLTTAFVDRERRLSDAWRAALTAAGASVAAAVVLAAGNPLHALLFEARDAHQMPALVHFGRDALVALAAALPIAAVVVGVGARRAAPARQARPVARVPAAAIATAAATTVSRDPIASGAGVTRRRFVSAGVGGFAIAGVGGAALSRATAGAQATPTNRLQIFINEGHVAMVDGSLVYMRGYGESATGDPRPSLTISPQVFLADGRGPIPSRHYPLVDASRIPADGCPADRGRDTSGPGLHLIHKRHWASFFPRRVIVAESGCQVRLRITNRLSHPHSFTIKDVVDVTLGAAGTATATQDVDFTAPRPGTYIYQDKTEAPVNRVLGLHGVLVAVPPANPWTFDGSEGEFERQWVWILHDIDPEWGRRARMGIRIDPTATPSLPRYFTINDRSGVFAVAHSPNEAENKRTHEDTTPCGYGRKVDVRSFGGSAPTGQLIRLVNTGIAAHQPHFHGNHVWTLAIDNRTLSRSTPTMVDGHVHLQHWEDVVELESLATKAVMLPIKPPPDALDVVIENQQCEWVFPMHCHAEMSQTAGGGLYPGGMVSDWRLRP